MAFRLFTPLLALLLTASAFGGEGAAPASQPARGVEGYHYLDVGSWIVIESHVRTNGTPATMKRRIQITADPKTHERSLQESRWVNDAFVPTGGPQLLARPDRRSFDQLGFTPDSTAPEQVVTIGGKRYVCTVSTYLFTSPEGRATRVTLWRDKSGASKLPPRTISINRKEIALPQDALQADITVEGPNISTRAQRRILSMASPLRVNGQTCNCLVEGTQTQGTSNGKPLSITVREWLCHDLPGERLRTVTAMTCGPMRVESDVTVLDFHVARLDAGIHAMPTVELAPQ
jgi:hypothetical protein